jgi:tyrosine-protein kinase Etk/Wzc
MQVLGSRSIAAEVADSLKLQVRLVIPQKIERDRLMTVVAVDEDAPGGQYRLVRSSASGAFRIEDAVTGTKVGETRIDQPTAVRGIEFQLTAEAAEHSEIVFHVTSLRSAAMQLQGGLNLRQPGEEMFMSVVLLVYQDTDPEMAAVIPNTIASKFIDYRRDAHRRQARNTVQFLTAQLDTLDTQLRTAEEELREFRERYGVVDLAVESQTRMTELSAVQAQRNEVLVQRNALSSVLAEVERDRPDDPLARSPYRRLGSHPVLLQNSNLQGLLSSLSTLEDERAELLERRTVDDPDVQAMTNRIQDLEQQMESSIRTYYQGLNAQVSNLGQVAGSPAGALSQIPAKEQQYIRLASQAQLLRETYGLLQSRLKEAEISQAVEDPNVEIIDLAVPPGGPIKPHLPNNLVMGLLFGLVLGLGTAFAREALDSTVHTREDLKDLTGVPVLGLIPRIGAAPVITAGRLAQQLPWGSKSSGNGKALTRADGTLESLVTEYDRSNAVSEAFRSLRTNITFSSAERAPKVFLVTSAMPKDGKTTTAANLAIIFAQQGLRVLLIDGDMRRGTLHKLFHLERTPGLSNLLVERCEIERAIHWVSLDQGTELEILPGGTIPPNPAELLSSSRAAWLMERLEERYDAIVVDTPPLTLVTDAAVLAAHADTVLFVARANKTDQGAIRFAIEQLSNVRAPLTGAVLNDVDFKRDSRYGRYDYAGYAYEYSGKES